MFTRELGEFENIVLVSVLRLGEGAYVVGLRAEIHAVTGRDVRLGAVESALKRLEKKGLLSSHMTRPTPEPGGRSKRLYELSPPGRAALSARREFLERLYRWLPKS